MRILTSSIVMSALLIAPVCMEAQDKMSNLVCFVRFAGEDNNEQFDKPFSFYQQIFNDKAEDSNSVYNYFLQASYGKLEWESSFFPLAEEDQVISYEAKSERGYYREKTSINSLGYEDEVEKAAREQALIKEVAEYLSKELPDDIVLDSDNNNIIDNMCIVISGNSELGSRHLLWPHRSDLALPDEKAIYIKDKKLTGYLMVFNDANGWSSLSPIDLNTGVLCHEISHSIGTYDLYHVNDDLNPVGVWDLMADNQLVAQQMTAYTKYRYCKWIDEIPEISEPGKYVLNPVGGKTSEKIAYKIKPTGSDEYFIVEYRKKEGTFESSLPESGIIVYRINPKYTGGNLNYNGTTRLDEQYIFRPGGTTKQDGDIYKAALSKESGRDAFGGNADLKPFYSDGSPANFAIANISECGETISFELLEQADMIYLSSSEISLDGGEGSSMEVNIESDADWTVSNVPEWLSVSPQNGKSGKSVITVKTLSENGEAHPRETELVFAGGEANAKLKVVQRSNLIQPPTSLKAEIDGNKVVLSWIAPKEGTPLLYEGFEDSGNPNKWEIRNYNDRGWVWQQTGKNNESFKGNYSARMKEAWIDEHQDEWLISPAFSNGSVLSFYSKSIAPGKDNPENNYFVEVSKDNGKTWEKVWDLMKDCSTVNEYVKVDIDLSKYSSQNMNIAFHAYDTNDTGLSYWWHIDEVYIYSKPEQSMVKNYAVYRNGVKIGTSDECSYMDESPIEGENIYTVRAEGDFGDTPDSDSVTVNFDGSGIDKLQNSGLKIINFGNLITVQSESIIREITVYSVDGNKVYEAYPVSDIVDLDISTFNSGLYILRYVTESNPVSGTFKFVK